MAPVYADHPFALIPDPRPDGEKTKDDMFDETACEMVFIHNCFIRGINAIYLQAPHVKPSDRKAFASFAYMWFHVIHIHHDAEETGFFPTVEKAVGEPGLMEVNVDQHKSFHDGLEAYGKYTKDCMEGRETLDGDKLVAIIDSFGVALMTHLTDEIDTLMGLRKYGEKLSGLRASCEKLAQEAIQHAGSSTGIIFILMCLDVHFEGGRWSAYPPIPWLVNMMFRYIFYWVHTDWWKFGPCDRLGTLRPLYAVPSE